MSEGRWFDAWVSWPELSGLAAAGRALLPQVPATPAALARTVTEQLVGRRLTTAVAGHEVGLTLTELDYPADSLRLATGRIGDVRIVAEDVDWPEHTDPADPVAGRSHDSDIRTRRKKPAASSSRGHEPATPARSQADQPESDTATSRARPKHSTGDPPKPGTRHGRSSGDAPASDRRAGATTGASPGAARQSGGHPSGATAPAEPEEKPAVNRIPLRRVTVLARDVRLRGLPSPAIVPSAVELHIAVSGSVLQERVARARPAMHATPHTNGFRVRWRKHPRWGYLTLSAKVDESGVVLTPTTLHIGRWTKPVPHRLRPIVLPLPDLPEGLRLTGVRTAEDELVLTTAADEWPGRLARIPFVDIVNWLTTAAMTLTLPGFARSLP
ncbi:hypothetical protein [Amycolatopsis jiangsuensis]|uniref:Uncharacterized protein n=1 Tax=Amycolatopsis jiangsuensis TaxID=1181879 RepID=A0A840IVC1_9PSEU|nr:hypothetical protein [Amycolatopsis jiangsuensis]MBB4685713.1 hypothetical protein [Amycolatopsis jiangsuensis]